MKTKFHYVILRGIPSFRDCYLNYDHERDCQIVSSYPLDVAGDINLTGDIRKNGVVWNPGGGGAYTLPPTTSATLGGVKIGAGITAAPDGTISIQSGTGYPSGSAPAGTIYIQYQP